MVGKNGDGELKPVYLHQLDARQRKFAILRAPDSAGAEPAERFVHVFNAQFPELPITLKDAMFMIDKIMRVRRDGENKTKKIAPPAVLKKNSREFLKKQLAERMGYFSK